MQKLRYLFIVLSVTALTAPTAAQNNMMSQNMVVLWSGPAGSGPASSGFMLGQVLLKSRLDANSDGTSDLVIKDAANNQLIAISGADRSQRWVYPLPDNILGDEENIEFISFADLAQSIDSEQNGTVLKEAVVARQDGNRLIGVLEGGKVKVESGVVLFGDHYVLLGIDDYDDDGDIELLLGDTEARTVEMWGAGE